MFLNYEKALALALREKAEQIAFNFSRHDRDKNIYNEQFTVKRYSRYPSPQQLYIFRKIQVR